MSEVATSAVLYAVLYNMTMQFHSKPLLHLLWPTIAVINQSPIAFDLKCIVIEKLARLYSRSIHDALMYADRETISTMLTYDSTLIDRLLMSSLNSQLPASVRILVPYVKHNPTQLECILRFAVSIDDVDSARIVLSYGNIHWLRLCRIRNHVLVKYISGTAVCNLFDNIELTELPV